MIKINSNRSKTDSKKMAFTGERYLPEIKGNIEIEHLHRYILTCELSINKTILDIACGEGYGSAKLAEKAKKVIGVDISSETIQHAKKRYKKQNLKFKVGSCSNIPLPDKSVDLVVSFETIEHHNQHEQMLKEIKRVLRPNGVLIISSPDKLNYSEKPKYNNPFHIKELYEREFKKLLKDYFKKSIFYGQRVLYGSSIFAESQRTFMKVYQQNDLIVEHHPGVSNPVYWFAIASDSKIPILPSGIFEQQIQDSDTVRYWMQIVDERNAELNSTRNQLNTIQEKNQNLTKQVFGINKMNVKCQSENQNLKKQIRQTKTENQNLENTLNIIKSAKFFKLWQGYCNIKDKILKKKL